MPRLARRDARVALEARAETAARVLGRVARVRLPAPVGASARSPLREEVAVVSVEDVAGRAPARAVVARLVVRPEEVERRVEEAGALEVQPDGVRPVERPEPSRAEA